MRNKKKGNLRVAIVHDWLVGGGAEKVVLELHKVYPDAPIYTSYCTPVWHKKLGDKVVTGPLQNWPFSKLRKFIPVFRIWWFTSLKFDDYDLVISSSGAEAKGIKTGPNTIHVSYIHAPTHYYWSRYEEYMMSPGFGFFDPLARLGLKALVGPLRKWDYNAAQRADYVIANSNHTKKEIKKYYGRDSEVIHPPVDTERFNKKPVKKRSGFVIVGRQTPYKRFDLAVEACTNLGLPLNVLGNGPDHERLRLMAGPTINFVPHPTDKEVVKYVSSAEGFIFPGIDDFGIAPVEALSAGTPVIAYKAGGALDYINPKTGEFFTEQTTGSLVATLKKFKPSKYSKAHLRSEAKKFSIDNFHKNIQRAIKKL